MCPEEFFKRIICWRKIFLIVFFGYIRILYFSVFSQIVISRDVKTEVYECTVLSSWEASFLKKKLFEFYFTFRPNCVWFMANFSNTVVKTAFFVSSGTIREEKFFENHGFFTLVNSVKFFWKFDVKFPRGLSELHSTCQGKNFMRKFPLKESNSLSDTRRKFSWLLSKVFCQDRQNWTPPVHRKLCEKDIFRKKRIICNIGQ